jgi:hypothetical protein
MIPFNEPTVREVSVLRILAIWRLILGRPQFETDPE